LPPEGISPRAKFSLGPSLVFSFQGDHSSWKIMEFSKTIFQAWKVMENSHGHGKSWKMMMMSWNFFVKMHKQLPHEVL